MRRKRRNVDGVPVRLLCEMWGSVDEVRAPRVKRGAVTVTFTVEPEEAERAFALLKHMGVRLYVSMYAVEVDDGEGEVDDFFAREGI